MVASKPTSRPVCEIGIVEDCVRGVVGRGHAGEIQRCYEDWACACLLGNYRRALLIGTSKGEAFAHLAARDAIASMVLAGVPAGFRLAMVAESAQLIAVYDAVVVEAGRRGLEARRFHDEGEALAWLKSAP